MSVRSQGPFCHSILPPALKILPSSAQSFSFPRDKHHSPFHLAKPQTWQKRTFNCLIYPQPNQAAAQGDLPLFRASRWDPQSPPDASGRETHFLTGLRGPGGVLGPSLPCSALCKCAVKSGETFRWDFHPPHPGLFCSQIFSELSIQSADPFWNDSVTRSRLWLVNVVDLVKLALDVADPHVFQKFFFPEQF